MIHTIEALSVLQLAKKRPAVKIVDADMILICARGCQGVQIS
jgi:hypothetical protein